MNMKIKNRVAELLAIKAREEGRGRISNMEVVRETGLSKYTVDQYVNNRITRYDQSSLIAFCQYLNCDIGDLLYYEEVEINPEMKTPLLATG